MGFRGLPEFLGALQVFRRASVKFLRRFRRSRRFSGFPKLKSFHSAVSDRLRFEDLMNIALGSFWPLLKRH